MLRIRRALAQRVALGRGHACELPRWETFRVFLYDRAGGEARQQDMHTHGGSRAFTNATIGQVTLAGRAVLVVSLFIPDEGSAQGEAGGVIYYRFID
jgi:hypothetical protein